MCDRVTLIRYSGMVHVKAYAFLWYTGVMVHCLASSPSHIPKNSGGDEAIHWYGNNCVFVSTKTDIVIRVAPTSLATVVNSHHVLIQKAVFLFLLAQKKREGTAAYSELEAWTS